MSTTIDTKKHELADLETVQLVTSSLFEVSAENISRLRGAFEKNRLFYADIGDLYRAVKKTAILRGHIKENTTKKMQSVSVVFTTNSRFYGSINSDVMNSFLDHIRATKRDFIVIGSTGRDFMENYDERRRCTFLSFENDQPTDKEMRKFLKDIVEYEQVYVFHPSFVNVFRQEVVVIDITHSPDVSDSEVDNEEIDYIFEPELPKILKFFETRVRYLLFQRAMLESELSRTSARLMAMNVAEERAGSEIGKIRREIKRYVETFNDMRLLESFSAISLWKK